LGKISRRKLLFFSNNNNTRMQTLYKEFPHAYNFFNLGVQSVALLVLLVELTW
jgi:hypothetical protein